MPEVRTRTPPDLKWLLVERATTAGDIARLEQRQAMLVQELTERRSALQSLDTTIRIVEKRVAIDAAGIIRAFPKEYGTRGALKEFIVSALKEASEGITMRALAQRAASHFELPFATKAEFTLFADHSVRSQVKLLKKQGFAEVLYGLENSKSRGRWRWRNSRPTLSELATLAAAN